VYAPGTILIMKKMKSEYTIPINKYPVSEPRITATETSLARAIWLISEATTNKKNRTLNPFEISFNISKLKIADIHCINKVVTNKINKVLLRFSSEKMAEM
jgi:hypothetical protein